MGWADRLRPASFRGVTFDVLSLDDEGGRTISVVRYVGRDGGRLEDLGAKARRGRLTAVVIGQDYENKLAELLGALSAAGSATLVHPVFGRFTAGIESWHVAHRESERDEAQVDFSWIEDGLDTVGLEVLTDTPAARATAVEAELGAAERLAADHSDGGRFIDGVRGWAASVRGFLTAVRNPNRLAGVRTATQTLAEVQSLGQEVIDTVRTVQDPNNIALIRQIKHTIGTANELGRLVATAEPPWQEYRVRAWSSARLIALELYGDARRTTEIVEANRLRDPGRIAPGTVLQVRAS